VIKATEVQDESPYTFEPLGPRDMLFIDSSHIVRLDGDVPFLLLEVLPVLRAGVLIHIHDIPFPYHCPYPARYWIYDNTWPFWWNESMLLHGPVSAEYFGMHVHHAASGTPWPAVPFAGWRVRRTRCKQQRNPPRRSESGRTTHAILKLL
jgi:hypothetical protein